MKTKAPATWKKEFLKKLDTMGVWEAMEELRLHRITLSISSVEPFDPVARYCETFNHDEKYQTQAWDDDEQMFGKAFYGKTPGEAFRGAVRKVLGGT
jgi:hypothetical protein